MLIVLFNTPITVSGPWILAVSFAVALYWVWSRYVLEQTLSKSTKQFYEALLTSSRLKQSEMQEEHTVLIREHANLNTAFRETFSKKLDDAQSFAMFIAYNFDMLNAESKEFVLKRLVKMMETEFESSLDGAHFVEMFRKTDIITEHLDEVDPSISAIFLEYLTDDVFLKEGFKERILTEIKKIFKNKKDNPLVSGDTLHIMLEEIRHSEFCAREEMSLLINEILEVLGDEFLEGINSQIMHFYKKKKKILKIRKVSIEDAYNNVMTSQLLTTDLLEPACREILHTMVSKEFEDHKEKLLK